MPMNYNITNEFIYCLYQKNELKKILYSEEQKELLFIKKLLDIYFYNKKKEKISIIEKYKFLN
tara:strand:+ start:360 stop:548 length:189 start_codon:yes stop_codon:yes gene_type:complete